MIRIQKLSTSGLLTVAFLTICLFAGCTEEMSVDELQQEKKQLNQRIDNAMGIIDERIRERIDPDSTMQQEEWSDARIKLEDLKSRLEQLRSDMVAMGTEHWRQFSAQALEELVSIKTTLDTMKVPPVEISEKLDI